MVLDPETERRALALFEEALDWDAGERAARLQASLAGEPELLLAVQALFAAHARAMRALPTQVPGLPRAPLAATPPARIGHYRLGALLGAGGMGQVYRGERDDGLFEQTVAIKLLRAGLFSQAAAERFADERRILARLRHPNIAQLLDGGVDAGGRPYIIMEMVDGQSIDEYVQARKASIAHIIDLMVQVCAAVNCAHQNLTVHADIKPSNIQVMIDGTVKLLDFGIARLLDMPGSAGLAPQSATHGAPAEVAEPLTRAYASPERRAGEPARPAGDIYSLGIVLHQLLTGVVPPGPALPNRDLAAIVACATAADPADRYGSALELAGDLQRHLRRFPVVARRPTWRYVSGRFIARHRWSFAGAALLLAALLVTSFVSTRLYLRAEAARIQTDQRFGEAREMVRFMLFDLHDELRRIPGTSGTRLMLLEQGEKYLQRLAASPGAPVDVKREVAVAYRKLGAVLGVPGEGTVGRTAAAFAALANSQRLLAGLLRAAPADDGIAVELARTQLIAARVHRMADSTMDEAARLNGSGLALLAGVLQRQPDDPVARLWHWSARVYQAEGDVQAAKFTPAVQQLQRLAAEAPAQRDDPQFPDYRLRVEADIQRIIGDAHYHDERWREALAAYQRAVLVLERGLLEKGDVPALDVALANALWNVAYMQADLDQGEASLLTTQRAEALVEHVLRFGPDAWAEYVRASVRLQRALSLQSLGRHREAAAAFEQSYAWERHNAERDPGMPNNVRSLAIVTHSMGLNLWQGGQRSQGCQWLQRSLEYWVDVERRWGLTPLDAGGLVDRRSEFARRCPGRSPASPG
ncbi:MAG: serine/threonine protein kinase [Gammaproteobacteria bacterium]|nr:serine/threonine protein kinase [Gammaproteobacteria bacterium]